MINTASGSTNTIYTIKVFARALLAISVVFLLSARPGYGDSPVTTTHGLAMHGSVKYPVNFAHFDYVSPLALKGGKVRLGAMGTFDSFNPFVPKGTAADDLSLIYETLMVKSADEPFSQYGLIAEKVEIPEDRSWIIFHINPKARFHDGHAITAEDVVFTFNLLIDKGAPMYRSYYANVKSVEALDQYRVRFIFDQSDNRELALIVGELPVLPKHFWMRHDFNKADLNLPLGSGPYRIKSYDAGRSVVYERVSDHWSKDLPVNVGLYNFENIQYDYYRDAIVLLEALKSGQIDYRLENASKQWATGYTGESVDTGLIKKEEIPHSNSTGMQGFAMNLRRPLFQDIRVRKALTLAYDFEWANANLFYGAYQRTKSYFSNSELASSKLPTGRELEILSAFKDTLPPEVFNTEFKLPVTDGQGHNRKQLKQAKKLLEEAGWKVKNNLLTHQQSGVTFEFEILLVQPSFERVINPYVQSLKKLGIKANVRMVDVSQYINRLRTFDFDMMITTIGQSQSPGNEQIAYWHSSTANIDSSRNYMGVSNPVVDQLVKMVVEAPDRDELVFRTRALDRVLLHQYYLIPQWHISTHRIAYWDKFGQPAVTPKYDSMHNVGLLSWWIDPQKEKHLQKVRSKK